MSEARIVALAPSEQQTVLRLQKMREEREAKFQDLLRQYCKDALFLSGAAYPRIPERAHLSVEPDGNIRIVL
jgi:hypothetical protein